MPRYHNYSFAIQQNGNFSMTLIVNLFLKEESDLEGLFFGVAAIVPSLQSVPKFLRPELTLPFFSDALCLSDEVDSLDSGIGFGSACRMSFSFVFRRRRSFEPLATGTASDTLTMLCVLKGEFMPNKNTIPEPQWSNQCNQIW